MKTLKTIQYAIIIALLGFGLSSCGVSSAIILHTNQNATQVQLGSNNFKVVDKISGKATASYVCMLGGLKKKQLYENAYSDMINKANLLNNSRAIINVVTEEHFGGVPPFYIKRTITISAHVIEFTR